MQKTEEPDWIYEISPKRSLLELNFAEIWRYRDLLTLFVKRNVVTVYKQTILGPLWFLIQPLLTTLTFTLIFNTVAGVETLGVPNFLFNLAGVSLWNYFKECLTTTSSTFVTNQNLFGKVYFPRVIMPMSTVISNIVKYIIQLFIFIVFYCYYIFAGEHNFGVNVTLLFFPFLLIAMALLGLGLGMILSSLTTKYRDMSFLITFGVQLLMYVSAVMYPLAFLIEKAPEYAWLVKYNPLALIVETFRYMVFSNGTFSYVSLFASFGISIFIFLVGLIIFNRTEKSFIDTV
ncbi:ABC transporter permease [Neptunitalea lumnitzerae]|uniref:Transport permease protein n=1 Tax=Neptunitalea lumnitzerae TaxID=2965509 RepID=A0ABQ5MN61_9FLAO|nr:ABC transporter permease [Neptunitalea sp. Y10]GLB50834.1 transport permease protein [Neptunitalea sp. Y10]